MTRKSDNIEELYICFCWSNIAGDPGYLYKDDVISVSHLQPDHNYFRPHWCGQIQISLFFSHFPGWSQDWVSAWWRQPLQSTSESEKQEREEMWGERRFSFTAGAARPGLTVECRHLAVFNVGCCPSPPLHPGPHLLLITSLTRSSLT